MKKERKISIITPIYNAEKYIRKCIESMINQTYQNIEIILINDGSTDNSLEICQEYQKKDKRIKIVNEKNQGVSAARNKGIEESTGDYITFVDADDYLEEKFIDDLVKNTREGILIGCNYNVIRGKKIKNEKLKIKNYTPNEFIKAMINDKIDSYIWRFIFETKFVKKMQFNIDTSYLEDMLFLIDYLLKSNIKKIRIQDIPLYNYCENDSSITKSKKRILEKIKNFNFSLEKINIATREKYKEEIEDKKIRLLESELRLVTNKNEIEKIRRNILIESYHKNERRYKFFSYIYRKGNTFLIKLYYMVRKIVKKMLGRG